MIWGPRRLIGHVPFAGHGILLVANQVHKNPKQAGLPRHPFRFNKTLIYSCGKFQTLNPLGLTGFRR